MRKGSPFPLCLVLCICLSATACAWAAQEPVAPIFEKLLRVPERVQVLQSSSHNKTGHNWDEYWPQYVDANHEEVLLDVTGPGCVKSMWGTNFDPNGVIRFYFDGETNARYEIRIVDFYKGGLPEFPSPLVSYERRGKYGDQPFAGNAFVPIPFETSLKITVQGVAHFYHLLYEKYPFGEAIKSFTGREDRSALRAAFAHEVEMAQGETRRQTEFAMEDGLLPRATVSLYHAEDTSGIIRELIVEGDGSEDFFQRTYLQMTWDSAPRCQVLAPIGIFFGSAVRANEMYSLPLDVEKLPDGRVRLRCRFPMAFWENAEITIVNRSQYQLAPIRAEILVDPNPIPRDQGTYFTTMYHEGETVYGHDWLLFEGMGSGWYVGTVQSMQYQHYCEGDEHFYVDGAVSPQINGTGSEDYYLACFWPNLDFDMPFGCVAGDVALEGGGYLMGFYKVPSSYSRYHLEAPIPFYSGISAKIQHGGLSHILSQYRSLAVVYLSHRTRLVQTDFLDIGNTHSEETHGYAFTESAPAETLGSAPEGDFFEALWHEDGRYHDGGTIRFTVAIDPQNRGVRLRRRLDQEVPCQGAKVFVDGTYAGKWYWGYRNEHLRWYDQDLDLQPNLTKNKAALKIRLECLPHAGIQIPESSAQLSHPAAVFTDFSYSVFCFQ